MKLHLGCGTRYIPGFKHIDIVAEPHVDVVAAVDDLFMIEEQSVDLIYACHVFEHFNRDVRGRVLAEWRRVLRPGGTLRVAVPDFESCARLYVEGGATLREIHGLTVGGQRQVYDFHYALYDFDELRAAIEAAGFCDVRRYDWRKTEHADVDDYSQAYLPHLDKQNGTLVSLNVEAERKD